MWWIVIGIVGVVGGASGWLVLRGTNSSTALIVAGALAIAFGVFQMIFGSKKSASVDETSGEDKSA